MRTFSLTQKIKFHGKQVAKVNEGGGNGNDWFFYCRTFYNADFMSQLT